MNRLVEILFASNSPGFIPGRILIAWKSALTSAVSAAMMILSYQKEQDSPYIFWIPFFDHVRNIMLNYLTIFSGPLFIAVFMHKHFLRLFVAYYIRVYIRYFYYSVLTLNRHSILGDLF